MEDSEYKAIEGAYDIREMIIRMTENPSGYPNLAKELPILCRCADLIDEGNYKEAALLMAAIIKRCGR